MALFFQVLLPKDITCILYYQILYQRLLHKICLFLYQRRWYSKKLRCQWFRLATYCASFEPRSQQFLTPLVQRTAKPPALTQTVENLVLQYEDNLQAQLQCLALTESSSSSPGPCCRRHLLLDIKVYGNQEIERLRIPKSIQMQSLFHKLSNTWKVVMV